MNRLALAVAALCAVVVVGVLWLLVLRRDAETVEPVEEATSAAPATGSGPAPPPLPEPVAELVAPDAPPAREAAAPASELGTLHIEADVEGAHVFIDRQYIGAAPVTAEAIAPGTHQVNVSAEGFDGVSETIDVEPGPRSLTFRLREVRLDASLDVVHRHGVGSCRGRLSATPAGLRFEAAEGDDSFSAALDELDAFEIDYLENALRVRIRNGRQYDFRDPGGNADNLFVFHRDVERARDRLP